MHTASDAVRLDPPYGAHALWNPAVAAGWSLVFTPAFGAWLVMRNWEMLGDARQAAAARRWFRLGLGLLGLRLLASAISTRLNAEPTPVHWITLLFLVAWWFGAALPQARAVKARFGRHYARRGWDRVLVVAVLAGTAYFVARGGVTWFLLSCT